MDSIKSLLSIPDRSIANLYSEYSEDLAYEYVYERLVSILAYRYFGIKRTDIRFVNSTFPACRFSTLMVSDRPVGVDYCLDDYVDRYLFRADNSYSDILKKAVTSFSDLFVLDTKNEQHEGGNEFMAEDYDGIVHLFKKNGVDIDTSGFKEAFPNLKESLHFYFDELYSGEDYGQVADLSLFVLRSETLGALMSDEKSEKYLAVKDALDVFNSVFGGKVIDGVYWGFDVYGDNSDDYSSEELPLILQPSFIAAVKILKDALCK